MLPQQFLSRQALDELDRAFRPPSVRVLVGIEQRHQRFVRADRGVVPVLANRGDDFALPRRNLGVGQRRRREDVGDERQHRLEVVGEARADEREEMTGDGDRERDAAAVELLGDLGGRPRRRAAVDDAREQPRQSGPAGRVERGAGAYGQVHGHGRRRGRPLREQDDAVVEDRARRLEAPPRRSALHDRV